MGVDDIVSKERSGNLPLEPAPTGEFNYPDFMIDTESGPDVWQLYSNRQNELKKKKPRPTTRPPNGIYFGHGK